MPACLMPHRAVTRYERRTTKRLARLIFLQSISRDELMVLMSSSGDLLQMIMTDQADDRPAWR